MPKEYRSLSPTDVERFKALPLRVVYALASVANRFGTDARDVLGSSTGPGATYARRCVVGACLKNRAMTKNELAEALGKSWSGIRLAQRAVKGDLSGNLERDIELTHRDIVASKHLNLPNPFLKDA